MKKPEAIKVRRVLEPRVLPDERSVTIPLESDLGNHELCLPLEILTILTLAALKARTDWDTANTAKLGRLTGAHVFPCDKWEIRKSDDGKFLLFGFRHVGGGWVRLQFPAQVATLMREVLEVFEGRANQEQPRRGVAPN